MQPSAHERYDGRFAPSPSGPLHLGNLRTALAAWLFARSRGARFLVRIEDLDPDRSRQEHAAQALADLAALGLDWDASPRRQSERTELYRAALERLRGQGVLYPCWCTRADVRVASIAPHGDPAPDERAHPCPCLRLTAAQRGERERSGRPSAWRLKCEGRRMAFVDLVHGRVETVVDDFVVWRGDDTPAYNLAVVVDDADQGIGEVVRGDDLLTTTPRQLLLAELLGLPAVAHAHVPLVLGADGRRLAKRHGAVTLGERLAAGDTVETVVGWMAWGLGLAHAAARLTPAELLASFTPERVRPTATVWDGGVALG